MLFIQELFYAVYVSICKIIFRRKSLNKPDYWHFQPIHSCWHSSFLDSPDVFLFEGIYIVDDENYDDDDDVILLTFIFLKEQMLMRVMFNVENVDDEYDAGVILTLKTFELKLSGTELMRPLKENVY